MSPVTVIKDYLKSLGWKHRIPTPDEYAKKPPQEIIVAYQQLRIAYDRYIAIWITLCLGKRKQNPFADKPRPLRDDIPSVKDALPDHIAKDLR